MPRPGQQHPIDAEWKAWVRRRLKELGKTQTWLASKCKCGQPAINHALSKSSTNTSMRPEIDRVLGRPEREEEIAQIGREAMDLFEDIPEADRLKIWRATQKYLQGYKKDS